MLSLLFAALLLGTQEAVADTSPVLLEIHDVRDLIDRREGEAKDEEGLESRRAATRLLALTVRELVGHPGSQVDARDGLLVVQGRPAMQQSVRDVLTVLRRRPPSPVHVQVQVRRGEAERCDPLLAAAGVDLATANTVGFTALTLEEPALSELRKGLDGVGCDVVHSPAIVALPLQGWSIQIVRETAYVADLVKVEVDGQEIVDPRIEVLPEGLSLEGHAVGLPGERPHAPWIGLRLQFSDLRVHRPIATRKTPLGTIQIPETSEDRFSFTTLLAGGTPVLLVGPRSPAPEADALGRKPDQRVLLLVRASLVQPEPEEDPDADRGAQGPGRPE